MSSQTSNPPTIAGPVFASILCGVDGSRPSFEAARQAALLAGPDAALTYAAVTWEQGTGATAMATLNHKHAQDSLRRVRDQARELGVTARIAEYDCADAAHQLIDLAARHDLLVVGIHGHSRAGGIMIGSAATAVLHRSPVPVLVARPPEHGIAFPERILLANDGSSASRAAAAVVAQLATRHGAGIGIVSAYDYGATPQELSAVAAIVKNATGVEPERFGEPGVAHRVATEAARAFGATLLVTGSHGLAGVAAIRSASERIAHAAPCSVLVVRPELSA